MDTHRDLDPPPQVSVVMPARNAEAFVAAAVASVLEDVITPLEVVVVDDGSTDATRAEVESLGDPRVRVVPGPERGISAALNAGVAASRGEFLARCDADDLFPAGGERLGPQVALLCKHPEASAVAGGYSTLTAAGREIAPLETGVREVDLTDELLAGHTRTHLGAWMIRRSAWEAVGGARPWFESAEDLDLQCRLADVGRVLYHPGVAYRYRLHDGSVTHRVPNARRAFFDEAVVTFSAQRASRGEDDLQRGCPPEAPPANAQASERPEWPNMSARWQAQGHLMAAAHQAHHRGDRRVALGMLGRAFLSNPTATDRWGHLARQVVSLAKPVASPPASNSR